MGEFADYALDDVMEAEEDRFLFRMGCIDHIDAYDRGIIDELGYEISSGKIPKTCRCCGESGLYWLKVNNKWVLGDVTNKMHHCSKRPLIL